MPKPKALLLLPLFAALLQVFSLPGWIWGPLSLFYAVPRIAYWERRGPWWGDVLGGFVWGSLTFAFLEHTHILMPLFLGGGLCAWWLGARFLYYRIRRFAPPSLAGPLALLAIETLRSTWPMQGVPWGSLGLGWAELPGALKLASGIGETGLTVLALFTGGMFYALVRRGHRLELALAPLLWLGAWGFVLVSAGERVEPVSTIRCLAVQPNISISDKVEVAGARATLMGQIAILEEAWKSGERPELALWAETMYPYMMVQPGAQGVVRRPRRSNTPYELTVKEAHGFQLLDMLAIMQFVRTGGYFITGSHLYRGIPEDTPPGQLSPRTTGMMAFDEEGDMVAHRPKSRLVPFGEELPFGGGWPYATEIAQLIFDFFGLHPLIERQPAEGPLQLGWTDGSTMVLGSAVCWENPFPQVFRTQAAEGAEAFVVLSNEAWFGLGAEMDQMIASTQFRAAETGRGVLRVTNTGVTIHVHPGGGLGEQLPRGEKGWLAADLERMPGDYQTPYVALGWLLRPLLVGVALLLAALSYLPSRARLDPISGSDIVSRPS